MTADRRAALPPQVPRDAVLVDTGLLVALYAVDDRLHAAARRWVANADGTLHTTGSVLTETPWHLPPRERSKIADLVHRGAVRVHAPDAQGYARIGWLLDKYADLDPDWVDIELVWLAEHAGIGRIATLDAMDFGVYRIHGRRRFEIVWPD
jgi:predicted nucleic acid-binding protein